MTRSQCPKPFTAKSRSRAEEAEREGTLILLEGTLCCECGARVGPRCSPDGVLIPTRHFPSRVVPLVAPDERQEDQKHVLRYSRRSQCRILRKTRFTGQVSANNSKKPMC